MECFNRTFMELKFLCLWFTLDLIFSFNRTFMELKYGIVIGIYRCVPQVLIVPLWN